MQELIRELLVKLGEDPDRKGLQATPKRVAESWKFLTSGYTMDANQIVNNAIYEEKVDEMVVVKHINFYSMCEHHLLPFIGVCHVGYIPNGKIIGLSKIGRIVEMYARRLQLQERMTQQIAQCLNEILQPKGIGVVTEAQHLCMIMRGVQKQDSCAVASAMLGGFETRIQTRNEFLNLIGQNKQ